MRETIKNIEDLIDTFENTGDYGNFFIGDYSNVEIAIYIRKQQEEIERLNNIINELEKYINETKLEEFEKEYGRRYAKTFTQAEVIICNMILNKLKELKDSDEE